MFGERLGVDMHVVTAAAGAVRNLTTCVARCHLDVARLVVSPYAAGLAALVEDEMDLGVTVIDMGGGTTSHRRLLRRPRRLHRLACRSAAAMSPTTSRAACRRRSPMPSA